MSDCTKYYVESSSFSERVFLRKGRIMVTPRTSTKDSACVSYEVEEGLTREYYLRCSAVSSTVHESDENRENG